MAKKTLTQSTYDTDNIQSLANQVKGQATALKVSFDKTGNDAKTYNNGSLIVELQSETPNATGANAIGSEAIMDTGITNVGDELKSAKVQIDTKVDDSNVLTLDNTTSFTPDADYEPATKKYIDDTAIAGIGDGSLLDIKLSNTAGQILDRVATNTAKESIDYTATVPSASWTGGSAPYTKVVAVTGILATDTPIVDMVPTGTYATDVILSANWALVYRITTALNSITVYANKIPSADMPIILKAVR